MSTEVRVPTLGESVTEATVASWYKKPGDRVARDEMLCELETDKVSVEVPAPAAGTLDDIVVGEGETVEVDALLANLAEDGGAETQETGSGEGKAQESEAQESESREGEAQKTDSGEGEAASGSNGSGSGTEEGTQRSTETADRQAGTGETADVMVPALGESVTEATVASWYKKAGEQVARDEMLCELETDKVSVEVPAPRDGTLSRLLAEEGETVAAGARLAEMTAGAGGAAESTETAPEKGSQSPPKAAGGNGRDVEDAPSAKKMMAEKGLGAGSVRGSGRDGRVMKEDVRKAAQAPAAGAPARGAAQAPASKPAPAARGPVSAEDAPREERVKMTRLRQTIARRLKDAQNTAAMLTTYNEVDMTAVMELRSQYKDTFEKKHGVKLGFMSFFTKACCHALMEVPEVNAELDGDEVVYKHFVHMGVAVGTPNGLVVPVVRDADSLSFAAIEKTINELGAKARDNKLTMAELQGGSFTVSNGGIYGSLISSPILNPPQSGILGMHKIQSRPMVVGGEVTPRPMMYLALSYDHRVVDGQGAVTFLVRVKEALEDPRRMLMDL